MMNERRVYRLMLMLLVFIYRTREESPNDPKLSDGGAWRGSCAGEAKGTATDVGQRWLGVKTPKPESAATVTRGAVRCSAWLGVAGCWVKRVIDEMQWRSVEPRADKLCFVMGTQKR
jgi:hypothetical protein